MDPITRQAIAVAAGAGGGDNLYVDDVFSTFLYEGNNSTNVINNGIDLSGEGGLVWIKDRENNGDHFLYDTERGAAKYIRSNVANSQTSTGVYGLQSFNSNGFTLGANWSGENGSGYDICSWTFRKAPGFFDIVTYTGDSDINRTVSHSLGSVPGMIVVKKTSGSGGWYTWHRSLGGTGKALEINSTAGTDTNSNLFSTLPTATVFSPGDNSHTNQSGQSYVAYLFAHDDQSFGTNGDEAIIKCGSYTGNSGTQEINLGFEPQWLLIKNTNQSSDWPIVDIMRGFPGYSTPGDSRSLAANQTSAEPVSGGRVYITSQGFAFANESNSNYNDSPREYIYIAIRRPNKPPEAGTNVFAIDTAGGTSPTPPLFTSGFVTDFVLRKAMDSHLIRFASRKQGTYTMDISTSPESSNSSLDWDFVDGWTNATSPVDTALYAYMFKRAPGFFDVTTYLGTGSNQSIAHNLGVTPELAIIKIRYGNTRAWIVWTPDITEGKTLLLNDSVAENTNYSNAFQANSTFTATNFGVGTNDGTNGSGSRYLALLFASLSGISKVGTYSGNSGYSVNVDCGFTAGARFVMIKRTDTEINPDPGTDWYVWDTVRGITNGNDPYFTVNQQVAQVTNTDYIDPLNAGFTVASSAPAALNASGGTYLFLAIA